MPDDLQILRDGNVGCWSWVDDAICWDETTRALFGLTSAPLDYAQYLLCIHPDDRARVAEHIVRFVANEVYEDLEHRVTHPDGSVRWLFARGSVVPAPDGTIRGLRGVILDITDLKAREQRLEFQATSDALTGLRNRRWLLQELPRELARAERDEAVASLIVVDVNGFKAINDGPGGHEAGDDVLIDLARRLTDCLRTSDALVRYGGDEFVALLPGTSLSEAIAVAKRMVATVSQSPVAGQTITISAGVSSSRPGDSPRMLVRRADRSMYRAKDQGGGVTGNLRIPLD